MIHPIRVAAVAAVSLSRCPVYPSRNSCLFCDSPDFDAIAIAARYPRSAKLFNEGEPPRGVFVLCSGRAKFSNGSSNGKSLLRVAECGEVLGLSAALGGHPYEGSAEMLEAGDVIFVRRERLLNYLRTNPESGLRVAQLLSDAYAAVHEQMRTIALSESTAERLARLLIAWCEKDGRQSDEGVHVKMAFTHGEIAQMIGASRETVTRQFSEWRANGIIRLNGSTLFVRNLAVLERIVNS